uniref:Uncharacterized protein n=1 Tax=Morchella brunnea TaxID=1174671 RepID=A0A8K1I820_9PEZI|nr:hypothetical protein LK370_mgp090 [Morchella brunnea]UBU98394.1 hypothetical protein [Morchella brunnea]
MRPGRIIPPPAPASSSRDAVNKLLPSPSLQRSQFQWKKGGYRGLKMDQESRGGGSLPARPSPLSFFTLSGASPKKNFSTRGFQPRVERERRLFERGEALK